MKVPFFLFLACFLLELQSCNHASYPYKDETELTVYKDSVVTDFFRRTTGWTAGDGAFSVPLADGRTLWNFGDSHANDYSNGTVRCLFNVRSSAMLQPANSWSKEETLTLLSPSESTLYKSNPAKGHFNWPAEGIQLGDTVYTYVLNLKHIEGGWERAGPDQWAKFKFPEMSNEITYTPLQDFEGIAFGDGLVKESDGFIYMYGKRPVPEGLGIENDLFIARFPQGNFSAEWTFWNGSDWVTDVTEAAPIGQIPTFSVHISKVRDKYLLVCTQFNLGCDPDNPDPPRNIYAATSDNITGPFSELKVIHRIEDELEGYYPFFYAANAHPQFINENNELLITYSINGYPGCVETCNEGRMDPDLTYRPRGIRVPLKLINPQFENDGNLRSTN